MQLASATVEYTPSQAMPPFTRVDLNQQATPVRFVIHQIEKVECLADAPILGQRPRQAGVTAAALKGLHQIVTSDYTKFERPATRRRSSQWRAIRSVLMRWRATPLRDP